jgi:hypothetical protein
MSREELLDAYVAGRIGRREFIRGLTAIGIAQSSAVLHAAALRPGSTVEVAAQDLYDDRDRKKEDKDEDKDDEDDDDKKRGRGPDLGPNTAVSGSGGVSTADADGGAVTIGDTNTGGVSGGAVDVNVRGPR